MNKFGSSTSRKSRGRSVLAFIMLPWELFSRRRNRRRTELASSTPDDLSSNSSTRSCPSILKLPSTQEQDAMLTSLHCLFAGCENPFISDKSLGSSILEGHLRRMCRLYLDSLSTWKSTSPVKLSLTWTADKRPWLVIKILPQALLEDVTSPEVISYLFGLLTTDVAGPSSFHMTVKHEENDAKQTKYGCRGSLHSFEQMWMQVFDGCMRSNIISYPSSIHISSYLVPSLDQNVSLDVID